MLVLQRGIGEKIEVAGGFVNGGITFTVVEVRGNKVRVGIDAPTDVSVHRREVQDLVDKDGASG